MIDRYRTAPAEGQAMTTLALVTNLMMALVVLSCCPPEPDLERFRLLTLTSKISTLEAAIRDGCWRERPLSFHVAVARHGYEAADALADILEMGDASQFPLLDATIILEEIHTGGWNLHHHRSLKALERIATSERSEGERRTASEAASRIGSVVPRVTRTTPLHRGPEYTLPADCGRSLEDFRTLTPAERLDFLEGVEANQCILEDQTLYYVILAEDGPRVEPLLVAALSPDYDGHVQATFALFTLEEIARSVGLDDRASVIDALVDFEKRTTSLELKEQTSAVLRSIGAGRVDGSSYPPA